MDHESITSSRSQIAIGEPGSTKYNAGAALSISGADGYGLHPNLTGLLDLMENGQAAIVQGVGYPESKSFTLHINRYLAHRQSLWTRIRMVGSILRQHLQRSTKSKRVQSRLETGRHLPCMVQHKKQSTLKLKNCSVGLDQVVMHHWKSCTTTSTVKKK